MNEFDREPWIADARALLDDSARELDAATLSRLHRARHAALASRARRPRTLGWFAAAGLACSGALLLAMALRPPISQPPAIAVTATPGTPARDTAPSVPADSDAAPADDPIEFYQDLDFYAWLDAEQGDDDG